MTKVKISHDSGRFEISVAGHSGYAPSGQDIVCAGISALSQTAAQMFAKMEAEGDLKEFSLEMQSGELHLFAVACKSYEAKAAVIYEYFCEGAGLIAQNYPDFLRIFKCGEKNENA